MGGKEQKKLVCASAANSTDTWYTLSPFWQSMGNQATATLTLAEPGSVVINFGATGMTSLRGASVALRCTVDGQPAPGGMCAISGLRNQWQTLSGCCLVKLPAGAHQVSLEYCCQVPGAVVYLRNPTLSAIGGMP
jgi:hypothetical protein